MRQLDGSIIAIVGLGLMGGSLAAALSSNRGSHGISLTIRGVARRSDSIDLALEQGFIDDGTCDLAGGVRDADIVVLSAPVRTSIKLLGEVAGRLKPGCIVTDVGSTKAEITRAMADLPSHLDPIGGHPMCGKEVAGLEFAEATLFRGSVYILTPLERTSEGAVKTMQQFAQLVGARCLVINPSRHDRLVAAVSHLPYLLAACLVTTTGDVSEIDPMVWELASSGFRDTSRLAGSEENMMRDILMTNQEPIRDMIHSFQRSLARFDVLLSNDDEQAMSQLMRTARKYREGMFR